MVQAKTINVHIFYYDNDSEFLSDFITLSGMVSVKHLLMCLRLFISSLHVINRERDRKQRR